MEPSTAYNLLASIAVRNTIDPHLLLETITEDTKASDEVRNLCSNSNRVGFEEYVQKFIDNNF
jgi:hypothetical protein